MSTCRRPCGASIAYSRPPGTSSRRPARSKKHERGCEAGMMSCPARRTSTRPIGSCRTASGERWNARSRSVTIRDAAGYTCFTAHLAPRELGERFSGAVVGPSALHAVLSSAKHRYSWPSLHYLQCGTHPCLRSLRLGVDVVSGKRSFEGTPNVARHRNPPKTMCRISQAHDSTRHGVSAPVMDAVVPAKGKGVL